MTEERRLLASGMPLEDAISNCHAMRRESTLPEFVSDEEKKQEHACRCGGSGKCADCPNCAR